MFEHYGLDLVRFEDVNLAPKDVCDHVEDFDHGSLSLWGGVGEVLLWW